MSTQTESAPASGRYRWAAPGDVNAFFGLMLDNVGDMILMAGLLMGVFGFPGPFVLTRMIPGTAVGVMVGDLIFTVMAFGLARRTGRAAVTAMPLGLDTPSTFGSVFLVLGPAFKVARDRGLDPESAARHAWFVGIAMILASGLFKLACAPACGWVRRVVPRAGLLGSLASIALVLISFLPLLDIAAVPVAGFAALAVILLTLTARRELPFKVPAALGALVVGCLAFGALNVAHLALNRLGLGPWPVEWSEGARPTLGLRMVLPVPAAEWLDWLRANLAEAAAYLPVAIPLALVTVVGGIDCAESAAAAGDDYPTGRIVAAEGVATLVGGAGVFGYFDWIFFLLPKSIVFPILIFVGLEITAQSFLATPRRHYPALALACVPALAYLASIPLNQAVAEVGKPFSGLGRPLQHLVETVTILSGGFIITSLLWATALAKMIDGRMRSAAAALGVAAVCALFGVIHSPLPDAPIVSPAEAIRRLRSPAVGRFEAASMQTPAHWAAAYGGMALVVLALGRGPIGGGGAGEGARPVVSTGETE